MATIEETKLIEKIARAKMMLESMRKDHSEDCMIARDPSYPGPCECGTDEHNVAVNKAIKELSFD